MQRSKNLRIKVEERIASAVEKLKKMLIKKVSIKDGWMVKKKRQEARTLPKVKYIRIKGIN